MGQHLEVEVKTTAGRQIFKVSIQMVDALAFYASDLIEPEQINIDDDPEPITIRGLLTRQLVILDEDEIPEPTEAGLALVETVDELYRPGRRFAGLKDAALVLRVQASGKKRSRRGQAVERSDNCVSCDVERDQENDKYWRRDLCNACYQRNNYHQKKAKVAAAERAKIAAAGGDLSAGQPPVTYAEHDTDALRGMLSVRLFEDDLALFMAITAIKEQSNAGMVRQMVQATAQKICDEREGLTIEGLLKTGTTLLSISGKKLKRSRKAQ